VRRRSTADRRRPFNYLGQFDGTLNRATAFRAATEPAGRASSPDNQRRVPLSILSIVHDGKLTFEWAASQLDPSGLGEAMQHALREIIEYCLMVSSAMAVREGDAGEAAAADAEIEELVL
jgi:hypothetical protein